MGSLRHLVIRGVAPASALFALIGGCVSTNETAGGPQYKYPHESDFCQAIAQADCSDAVLTACYGSATADNRNSCVSVRSAVASCDPLGLTYHPQSAEGCVSAHQSVYADATLTQDELDQITKACLPVLNNGGSEGSMCTADTDCDAGSGLACIIPLGTTGGTCAKPIVIQGGNPCTDPNDLCTDGYYCGADGYCIAERSDGQTCSRTQPCQDGFNCVGTTTSSTCVAKLADGSTCMADTECQSGFCVNGKCRTTYQLTNSPLCNEFTP